MEPETTTLAPGNGAASQKGFPIQIRPPDPRRATPAAIGIEVGGEIQSDGTLPLRISADAMETMRATWQAACELHAELLGKVNALTPEPAQQIRSRKWFYDSKQRSLRAADGALGEIRTEQKALEAKIARQTVPPILARTRALRSSPARFGVFSAGSASPSGCPPLSAPSPRATSRSWPRPSRCR